MTTTTCRNRQGVSRYLANCWDWTDRVGGGFFPEKSNGRPAGIGVITRSIVRQE